MTFTKKLLALFILLFLFIISCDYSNINNTNNPKDNTPIVYTDIDLTSEGIKAYLDLSKTKDTISLSNINGTINEVYVGENKITYSITGGVNSVTLSKDAIKQILGNEKYTESKTITLVTDTHYRYKINVAICTKTIRYTFDLTSLAQKKTYCDEYYVLLNDLDCDGLDTYTMFNSENDRPVSNWNPLTYDNTIGFNGIIDGLGHTISNITTSCSYNSLGGLFGQILSNGVIKNVCFENIITDNYSALTGESSTFLGRIENCYFSLAEHTNNIKVLWRLENKGIIKNCVFVGFDQFAFSGVPNTIENVVFVGGTGINGFNSFYKYDSTTSFLTSLSSNNYLTNWNNSSFSFKESSLYYNNKLITIE